MTKPLAPYGSTNNADLAAKVGKGKSPIALVARMPSADVAAKVGPKSGSPFSLAERMPSVEIAAKIGITQIDPELARRVVRRKSRA